MASFFAARTDEKSFPDASNLDHTNAFESLAAKAVAELCHTEDTNFSSLQKTKTSEQEPTMLELHRYLSDTGRPTQQAISSAAIVTKSRVCVRQQFAVIATTAHLETRSVVIPAFPC